VKENKQEENWFLHHELNLSSISGMTLNAIGFVPVSNRQTLRMQILSWVIGLNLAWGMAD
jgi:hypothetical protein